MPKSHIEKQNIIISQFERICKQAAWEEKNGKTNLSATEQAILEGNKAKAKRAAQPKMEDIRFSPTYAYEYVYGAKELRNKISQSS